MRKRFKRIVCASLVMSLIATGSTTAMASNSSVFPAAGSARVLGEGVSVAAIQAEQKKNNKSDKSGKESDTEATTDAELFGAGDSSSSASSSNSSSIALMAAQSVDNVTSEPEIITVGGASTGPAEEMAMTPVDTDEEDEGGMELADVFTGRKGAENDEEEDFTNLVIAQVDDFVNVRSEASEDSEVVGKLYNNSAGDLIEEKDDWYKIHSGSCTGYVKAEYCVTGDDAQKLAQKVGIRLARVTTTTLYVRSEPTKDSEVIGMVPIEDELMVLTEMPGWVKVSIEEGDGFVSDEFVNLHTEFVRAESKEEEEARLKREEEAREAARKAAAAAQKKSKKSGSASGGGGVTYSAPGSSTGSSVANYALQFVGNPYVYGGSSLTNGTDCSGFVMSVYRNFGVSLPHSSGGDRSVGYGVSGGLAAAQPGDIICYSGHVGIYIGGGQIVHASTARTGIKVSNANYRNVLAVRRIF